MEYTGIAFIWPWVGPYSLNMTNIGVRDGRRVVPGIAPPGTHPATPPRVHLPATMLHATATGTAAARLNEVVGLRSVDQLSLSLHFSGSRVFTEGYNLAIIDNPNDHKGIPGNK